MPTAEPPESWIHPQVHVGPSPIAGQGLFAGVALAAGTPVIRAGAEAASVAERVPANHSCDPNLGWAGPNPGDDTLIALRDIAAGEELTHDYATSLTDPGLLLRCNCGSMRCRGLIEGDDWQIPQLRRRYAGHFAIDVQRRIDAEG